MVDTVPCGGVAGCRSTAAQEAGQARSGQRTKTTCVSHSDTYVNQSSDPHVQFPLRQGLCVQWSIRLKRTEAPESSGSNELHELVVAHVPQETLQAAFPFK